MKKRHPITGCRAYSLMGQWLMEAAVLQALKAQADRFDLKELRELNKVHPAMQKKYEIYDGVALLEVSGPVTKYPTSFQQVMGGTSSLACITALDQMADDPMVKDIVLGLETPGGNADGFWEFAQKIKEVDRIKPVYTHAEDSATSYGQFLSVMGREAGANLNARMGSVGALSFLHDSSKRYEKKGIKVIPLGSGKYKGMGAPGVKITDEQIAHAQQTVEEFAKPFLRHLRNARGLSSVTMEELATAKVITASKARKLGLVDFIGSRRDFIQRIIDHRKQGTVPVRGRTTSASVSMTATTRRDAMLTSKQLKRARKLPGAAKLTAENADQMLLRVSTTLSEENAQLKEQLAQRPIGKVKMLKATLKGTELKPAGPDKVTLKHYVQMADGKLDLAVQQGKITPAQKDAFRKVYMVEDTPVITMLTPDEEGNFPYETALEALTVNKTEKDDVKKEKTGAQPAAKIQDTPPANGDEPKITPEREAQIREQYKVGPAKKSA